jgi:type VII secretion-associated protein (TIGR03931 family)
VVAAANTVTDHIEAVSADRWDRPAPATPSPGGSVSDQGRNVPQLRALPALTAAVLLSVAGVWFWSGGSPSRSAAAHSAAEPGGPGSPGRTLVEGRMTVRVPAPWAVQRVTSGPGARRLRATSPDEPLIALHLTWSYAPDMTLADAAGVLARAMAEEPSGVFADFRAEATVAGRPVVTYRELRPGRVITWIVVLTGSTRISIGCQSPPGRDGDVREVCDDAVRSAQET